MSLVSNQFLLLAGASLLVYYLAPARIRWMVLLLFSYLYYIMGGIWLTGYLFFSTIVTFVAARLIGYLYEKGEEPKKAKWILVPALLLNLGMLCVLKYTGFLLDNVNALFHTSLRGMDLVLPLGLSFYTFQSSGYLLDVYWKRVEAEKNPLKYALFVSYFPQLMQGPIGRYSLLAHQLYEPHGLKRENLVRGAERMLWGFFKKMVIADWAVVFVDAIFDTPDLYQGVALFGAIFYMIELYADFSGAMDVVIGLSQMFGITLEENFRRPFFATSMSDFWHRWHITLGNWMKEYLFYPVSLSGWMAKFSKWAKKTFGRKTGRVLPIALADIIVFLAVGVWHGPQWKYVVYGLYNGLIIGTSELLAGKYREWKKALHITGKERWYFAFMLIRTLFLTLTRMYFDRADSVRAALSMMKSTLTSFQPSVLLTIPAGRDGLSFTPYALLIIVCGCVVLFTVEVLQERGIRVRESLAKLPLPATAAIYFILLLSIGLFGSTAAVKGFIYAQF
ncbi:MAG: MBOAT family protein [Lachnospiraceae bacterium]|nr:MBOAT family protein [Lachnospiraceae bacterium]